MNRRHFLQKSIFAGSALLAPCFSIGAAGANDRIGVAIVGIHDRGMDLAQECARIPNVDIRYLADPDSRLFEERLKMIEGWGRPRPKCVQDFRLLLDDPDLHAIFIATPDHWHALATILACQAGKDVYVEKPTSHNVWESRKMVEVARKYNRVVQVGTQNRSAEYCQQAVDYVRSGKLGDVHFIRIMNSKQRESIAPAANTAPPDGVDFNLWLGPAPVRPYSVSRFHYNWHWFWDYSGGDIINDGVHQIDLARWVANRTVPKAVSSTGATYVLNDGRDTPDTQTVTWEFEGLTMVLEQALWTPFLKKVPLDKRDSGQMPNWTFDGTRIEVYGTKQFMFFGRMGGGYQIFDADGNSVAQQPGKFAPACTAHVGEFIECVKSRKKPSADIEEGHYSTALAHYGNIAFRVGRRLHLDETKECFVGDDEAQPLLKRGGREGFTVPESV